MITSIETKETYINLNEKLLNINKDVSFMFWVKCHENDIDRETAILSQVSERSGADRFQIGTIDKKFILFTGHTGTIYMDPIEPETWYHIAVTISKDLKCNIYINGELKLSETLSGFQDDNTYLFAYGINSGSSNYYYNGLVSEFKFYKRELTQDEIIKKMKIIDKYDKDLYIYFNFNIVDKNFVINQINNKKYKITNFVKINKDNIPKLLSYKFLLKQNDILYNIEKIFINYYKNQFHKEEHKQINDKDILQEGFNKLNDLFEKRNTIVFNYPKKDNNIFYIKLNDKILNINNIKINEKQK